jgi:hypothetical protein
MDSQGTGHRRRLAALSRQLCGGEDPDESRLTLDEKIGLKTARDIWHNHGVARLGVAGIKMRDGPSGVRGKPFFLLTAVPFSLSHSLPPPPGFPFSFSNSLSLPRLPPPFLITNPVHSLQGGAGFGVGPRSACVPCSSALAATWNPSLVEAVGKVLGDECHLKGVNLLLGPTCNIHR